MEKETVKELLGLWKVTNRLILLAGIVACWMFLGLSFVRPHLDKILYLAYFPGILYALYFAYRINKIRKRLNQIKDSVNNGGDRT